MARRKQKKDVEEVTEVEEDNDMANDIDEIETVLKTVPEPTEVDSNAVDTPSRGDVMLPRSASRYVKSLG